MKKSADLIASVIEVQLQEDADREAQSAETNASAKDPVAEPASASETEDDKDEEYGPKTAAMPDPTVYSSSKIREVLDVGDLPEDQKEAAWNMLETHVKAFGFDGRLGSLEGEAKIRLKEGVEPISMPMYNASPAKREVIDKQIDTWFEQGVIEPSKSPWGAPVVIAYRNNKPRF
ncbi:hypothetical protein BDZ89DRAFT_956515, partial [Hymenopellis radicata]